MADATEDVREDAAPQMTPNPITPTIPFDRDGAHHGFLRLPHSRDDSAWGSVMIPITVIRNGDGPTALFTGGNHGDEYEGPVALMNLAATLDPAEITGRVIIVPAVNFPAFRAATRTSPIDKVNLNRAFPGSPAGTVTRKIADYFNRTLVPIADILLDYHSGGKTLDFLPFAAAHILDDKIHQAACVAAMQAFNAPYSMTMLEIDSGGMYDDAVESPRQDLRHHRARRRRHRDRAQHRDRLERRPQPAETRRHSARHARDRPHDHSRHAR